MSIPEWARELLDRMGKVEDKVGDLSERMGKVEAKLGNLEGWLDKQNGRVWTLSERQGRLTGKVAILVVLTSAAVSAIFGVVLSLLK